LNEENLKLYKEALDLYKFYWNIALQLNAFYYVLLGASLVYYFQHSEIYQISFILILLLFVSLIISILSFFGAYYAKNFTDWFELLLANFNTLTPTGSPLVIFLIGSGLSSLLIFIAIILLF
jgi:hypothetical protein